MKKWNDGNYIPVEETTYEGLLANVKFELKTAISLSVWSLANVAQDGGMQYFLQSGRITACERILGLSGRESQAFSDALWNLAKGELNEADNKIANKFCRIAGTTWAHQIKEFNTRKAESEAQIARWKQQKEEEEALASDQVREDRTSLRHYQ